MLKTITCRQDAIDRVSEIMGEHSLIVAKNNNSICLCDIMCEIKDTEDVETLVELKNHINSMFENEIIFRLKDKFKQ
jgi:hypothetical protein